jgi:K+-transporting ATPase ATPase B chain
LDKTGTTIGRKATPFIQQRNLEDDFIKSAVLSWLMTRPKAKVLWNWQELKWQTKLSIEGATLIKFTAETRTSGVVLKDGTDIRKGARMQKKYCTERGTPRVAQAVIAISSKVERHWWCKNAQVQGVIELQDIIKRE